MRRLVFAALLALGACATTPHPPVQAVPALDLTRYMGLWYEIARLPNRFEDGAGLDCAAVTASYTPLPGNRLAVRNLCHNARDNGARQEAEASGYVVEGSHGARLRIAFFWPLYADYWVIGLDPAYRWAVVGDPAHRHLWILARQKVMAPGDYAEAVGIAAAQGFAVEKLKPTMQ